jgi:hypothetical protein
VLSPVVLLAEVKAVVAKDNDRIPYSVCIVLMHANAMDDGTKWINALTLCRPRKRLRSKAGFPRLRSQWK